MPSKEKVLLFVVLAAVAGVAAMDKRYLPVPIPATKAPTDIPPAPGAPEGWPRSLKPAGRSMYEQYSDLQAPPPTALPDLPVPALPTAVPPVRPWPHMDAAGGIRHFLFDPAEKPVDNASGGGSSPDTPPAEGGGEATPNDRGDDTAGGDC